MGWSKWKDYQKWLEENGLLHDEKSYSSPEVDGYDIGLDSDEERERAQAALEAARIAKERAFVNNKLLTSRCTRGGSGGGRH